MNALVLLGLSFLLYSALRSFFHNVGDISLRFTSSSPLLSFIVFYLIKALPFLLKSRYTKILQDVNKFDRHNFSEETGFMGIVKKEVEYLFDFLQTHYQRDTELEIRRPLRLAVFVDDLDRCQTKTIMKVLQAVILSLALFSLQLLGSHHLPSQEVCFSNTMIWMRNQMHEFRRKHILIKTQH